MEVGTATAQQNSFANVISLKDKPFTRVYGLWVCPIIGVGANGGYEVVKVNHNAFNYRSLAELMGELFGQTTKVQLRLPNDSIDVATFDERLAAMNASDGEINSSNVFSEFGKLVIRNASAHDDGVIDIRKSKAWCSLKSKAAQVCNVYPPQILPLCILSDRAEDIDWWYVHALSAIDNAPLPLANLARAFSGKPPVAKSNQGVLPTHVLERLGAMFKCAFEPKAMLIEMTSHN